MLARMLVGLPSLTDPKSNTSAAGGGEGGGGEAGRADGGGAGKGGGLETLESRRD